MCIVDFMSLFLAISIQLNVKKKKRNLNKTETAMLKTNVSVRNNLLQLDSGSMIY